MQPSIRAVPAPHRRLGLGALIGYASGAVTAAGALGVGVLAGQVLLARKTIPGAEAPPPRSTGLYGRDYAGAPIRLAVLGDSTAAGYGVSNRDETPGALLANWIATAAHRPVRLTCPAVVGSVSAWLPGQVETATAAGAELAVIFIGANDVTTRAAESVAVGHLVAAVRDLRAAGAEVVVATCPDLGTVRPILPPLRWLARRWSRQLAHAQTVAAVEAGARTVSLADLLGPQFAAAPDRMFGQDRFHPSVEGYLAAAGVVRPAALAALGLSTPAGPSGPTLSLDAAATAAVDSPGTEVVPLGPGWLRHHARLAAGRLRHATTTPTALLARASSLTSTESGRDRVPSVGMSGAVARPVAE